MRRPSRTGPGTPKQAASDVGTLGCGGVVVAGEEVVDDVVERGELVRGELLVADGVELAACEVVKREMDFGAAYVSCEDHLVELQSAGVVEVVRRGEFSRCGGVEQEGESAAGGTDELRGVGVGLVGAEEDVVEDLGLGCAFDEEGYFPALVDDGPGEGDAPGVLLGDVVGDGDVGEIVRGLRCGGRARRCGRRRPCRGG